MKHSVHHDLEPEMAKTVLERAWESYRVEFSDYNPTFRWQGDSMAEVGFSVKGVRLQGQLELRPKAIELDLKVPFLLKPFRGAAVRVIDQHIQKWITKAKLGQL